MEGLRRAEIVAVGNKKAYIDRGAKKKLGAEGKVDQVGHCSISSAGQANSCAGTKKKSRCPGEKSGKKKGPPQRLWRYFKKHEKKFCQDVRDQSKGGRKKLLQRKTRRQK